MEMNPFNVDLENKKVKLSRPAYKAYGVKYGTPFLCTGGFGCDPKNSGRTVFGKFEGEDLLRRVSRGDVDAVLVEDNATESK